MTSLSDFTAHLDFPLDEFQEHACESVLAGKSVLTCAPTGAGKTLVGECALFLALESGTKAFYTTPIKALSNQKYADLVARYGAEQVGLLTGDRSINSEAPVVVMTTEVLRNMLYAESDTLNGLSHVVMDEVHYLADRSRGGVWEEVIIGLALDVRLIALSATVSNYPEFADWLCQVRGDVEVVVSTKRPVPLYQHMMVGTDILDMFDKPGGRKPNRFLLEATSGGREQRGTRGGAGTRDRRRGRDRRGRGGGRSDRRDGGGKRPPRYSVMTQLLDAAGLTPAICFIFSRQGCERAVDACRMGGVRLTTSDEARAIRSTVLKACSAIGEADRKALRFNSWLDGLTRGVAAHHAGIVPPFKKLTEELFEKGLVKMVFATETLALGVNMPARCVVIDKLVKYNGIAHVELTPGEYTQLTGRAGRRGMDTEGHAVVLYRPGVSPKDVAGLASALSYPLKSSFAPTYNMAVNLIDAMGAVAARQVLESSFAQFQTDRSVLDSARRAQEMQEALDGYREAGWDDRAKELSGELRKTLRHIEKRTGSLVRLFDRLCRVLHDMGYISGSSQEYQLTDQGVTLKTVYSETDLLIAECLRRGTWNALDAPALAAIASTLVYNARTDGTPRSPDTSATNVLLAWALTMDVCDDIHRMEKAHGVPSLRAPHPGAVPEMLRWAHGDDLDAVLDRGQLTAGDFVRLCRQTIDVLDQIRGTTESDDLRRTARKALDAIDRGVVAVGMHS